MSDYRSDVDELNDEYYTYRNLCQSEGESPLDYYSLYWIDHYEKLKNKEDEKS